ncbi:hypothetical protein EDD25_0498 [Cryobacterium psychrophilum]|nr:hypothetical protein EDD25_0498 [Cryobacterium psychrophilum]
MLKTVTNKQRSGVDENDLPDFADKICAPHSVSRLSRRE